MRYNIEKFQQVVECANRRHGGVMDAAKRRGSCHKLLEQLRGQQTAWRNESTGPLPRHMEISLRTAVQDLEVATEEEARAVAKWQEAQAVNTKCKAFLKDRGVPIPETRLSVSGGGY